jgi:hypothetical protein
MIILPQLILTAIRGACFTRRSTTDGAVGTADERTPDNARMEQRVRKRITKLEHLSELKSLCEDSMLLKA